MCETRGSEAIPPPRGLEGGVCLCSWYDPIVTTLEAIVKLSLPKATALSGAEGAAGSAGKQDPPDTGF